MIPSKEELLRLAKVLEDVGSDHDSVYPPNDLADFCLASEALEALAEAEEWWCVGASPEMLMPGTMRRGKGNALAAYLEKYDKDAMKCGAVKMMRGFFFPEDSTND